MPFTPAHPLVVLPLMRWRKALHLDATCLVIGTMAPDFEYFIHGEQRGNFSHSLRGMFAFGVPTTLLLAALFHAIVKWPLVLAAPRPIAMRTVAAASRPWPGLWTLSLAFGLVVSAAVGNFSHIVWDSFTHTEGWGARHVPMLDEIVTVPVLGELPIHRVIQYACSLIGLVGIAAYTAYVLRRQPSIAVPAGPRAWPRTLFAGSISLATAAAMFRALGILHATDPGSIVVSAISGTLVGVLAASVVLHTESLRLRAAVTE